MGNDTLVANLYCFFLHSTPCPTHSTHLRCCRATPALSLCRERLKFCYWCVWCLLVLICYSLTRCLFSLPFCWSQRRSPVSVPLPPPPWVSAHMSHAFCCFPSLTHFAFGLSRLNEATNTGFSCRGDGCIHPGSARLPIRTWTESSRFPKSLVHLFTTSVAPIMVPAVGENVRIWQLDPLMSYFSHFLLPCLPLTPTLSSVSCTLPFLVLAAPSSMSLCLRAGTRCQSTQGLFKVKLDRWHYIAASPPTTKTFPVQLG